MKIRVFPSGLVFTALLFIFSVSASAATITNYSDRAIFDAAVGSTTTEDFLPDSHGTVNSGILNQFTNEGLINPGDIQAGVTYSTSIGTGPFFNIDAGGGFVGGFLDSVRDTGSRPLTIDFDLPVSAFGFDTNSLMGNNYDITFNFLGGSTFTQNFGVVNMEFFGFQSDLADIASVVIQGNGSNTFNFALDNFSFDGQANVPVPAALWLLGSGLLGLMGIGKGKRAA